MIENVLERKHASLSVKITVKTLVAALVVALAVTLPQIAHITFGQKAGVTLLPMYLPVLLGGCLMGAGWGIGIGLASPLVSFIITSAAGSAMPAAARLPFMMAELAVFAAVCGLFGNKIKKNAWFAFPAVILAEVCGRAFFMLSVLALRNVTSLSAGMIWGQIKTGWIGLVLNAVIVPLSVVGLSRLLGKNDD